MVANVGPQNIPLNGINLNSRTEELPLLQFRSMQTYIFKYVFFHSQRGFPANRDAMAELW